MHPDDIGRAVQIMEYSKRSGEYTILESRIITRSGTEKILTMTFSYVSAEDSWDGIPSFYSVGIDVTKEREEQERQRRALEDAFHTARVASLAKTNFLSSMSHDIRTPMNAIMGMAAIAQANLNAPEKVRDCLHKIGTSSRHLLSPEKSHRFQISIGQVSHENVISDGDRLRQILMNLLSNAIKYTPDGGDIILRINEIPVPNSRKSQYEFICIDNGIGISEEMIPSIFEPFWRAKDPRISKLQGTGLGMTITENVVRMMNGTIKVESELGKGSKFTVSVPLELCIEEESYSSELVGLPVLVIDDDQITCENAAALLNELGMRGDWVLSGAEAVIRVDQAHRAGDDFFAVILDWIMPEMDGVETVKAIRGKLGVGIHKGGSRRIYHEAAF